MKNPLQNIRWNNTANLEINRNEQNIKDWSLQATFTHYMVIWKEKSKTYGVIEYWQSNWQNVADEKSFIIQEHRPINTSDDNGILVFDHECSSFLFPGQGTFCVWVPLLIDLLIYSRLDILVYPAYNGVWEWEREKGIQLTCLVFLLSIYEI